MNQEAYEKKIRAAAKFLPAEFDCPENMRGHLGRIFEGEYDVPLEGSGFSILDLGANCGAFTVWAARKWPNSEITAYEPVPSTFEYLTRNVTQMLYGESVTCVQAAVHGSEHGTAKIALGVNNCGEASLHLPEGSEHSVLEITTVPVTSLPLAQILKLDIEGSEYEVLKQLIVKERRNFHAILLEYHSEWLRRCIDVWLSDYVLVTADIATPGRGTLCYLHHELLNQNQIPY